LIQPLPQKAAIDLLGELAASSAVGNGAFLGDRPRAIERKQTSPAEQAMLSL
jgi:hypothetical protein